jgi:hypothetical protein
LNTHLESALFYTMSTIAQTLSGGMGLLGAIVLFALQETTRSVERAAKQLTELEHASMSPLYIKHLLTRRSFRELARLYGRLLQPGGSAETSADLLVYHSTLSWELEHDQALRRSFWKALLASGFVIGFSLACVAFAPRLAQDPFVGQVALVTGLAGSLGCLVLYGVLLRVMFRATPEEPSSADEAETTS